MLAHEHTWTFADRASGWSASCPCGLAVAVEEQTDGRTLWEWLLHDATPPTEMLLNAISSVMRARRAARLAMPIGRN